MAALAVLGLWVPFGWWPSLTIAGAAASLVLLVLFPGPTKLIPMAFDLAVFWAALSHWPVTATK
jgi:hypothetical protein